MLTGSSGEGTVVGMPAKTAWTGAAEGVEEEEGPVEGGPAEKGPAEEGPAAEGRGCWP